MGYYFGILLAVAAAALVVGILAFPSAVAADRLFQRKGKSRVAPYALFLGIAVAIVATLLLSRDGEIHALDVPAAIVYFLSASCIVWKISFESPKRKNG